MPSLTIQKISRKPITTKYGETQRISILTSEYNEKWLSGFEDDLNKLWNEGDVVEATVSTNGEYLNFKAIQPSVLPNATQPQRIVPPPISSPTAPPQNKAPNWDKIRDEKTDNIKACNALNNACLLIAHGQYPVTTDIIDTIRELATAIYKIQINGVKFHDDEPF